MDLDSVARKSVRGVFALVSRTFLIQILGVATSFILTIFLSPTNFGVFFVVSSIIVFFNYFQDIGLAASLIQKKKEPTILEFQTVFTVQQILVLSLVIPAFAWSRQIASFYNLDSRGYLLLIALLASFVLSSLRTIPTILLERRLEFGKLVVPQIVENIFYNVSLIVFAVLGFGVTSFTIAVLARAISGLVATYLVQPWNIGIAFDFPSFKKLISFGIPFQANSILALVKDDLLTIYLGKVLPFAQVGYIGFSQKWAYLPLRLVMDNVIKVTFPSYSRLQHDKDVLKLAIEKSLFLISFFIFPTVVGIVLLSPYMIQFFPRWEKWEPALLSLMFFSLNIVFSSISTPLTNFLNAIGRVKITLYFMIFWTVATWILTLIFIQLLGFNGVAVASFVVSISSVFVLIVARRFIRFEILKPIVRQFLAAIVMGIFIFLNRGIVVNLPMLIVEILISGVFYALLIFLLAREELLRTLKFISESIRSS